MASRRARAGQQDAATRAVPKERVRLDKDTVTEERQVSEEVRKEQIQVDGDQERFGRQDQR